MKILFFIFASFFVLGSAQAVLNMKPGKWRIQTTMVGSDGTKADPMAKMRDALAKMSPEKRKQMEAMMAQMKQTVQKAHPNQKMPDVQFDKDGMTMCYTKEMLNSGLDEKKKHEARKCKITDHQQTSTLVSMKFNCENGSSGTTEWKVVDDTHMSGSTKTVNSKGQKHEVDYKAQFLSAKCD